LDLSDLKYAKGAIRHRKRLGVGTGSGRGGTCGRGTKGLKSRSGGKVHPWFEGGQMPLQRRLPKRGFRKRSPLIYQVVNLRDLERVGSGSVVDAMALAEKGLIKDPEKPVKVLGDGEVKGAYAVKVTAASRSAVEKIEAAGGTIEVSMTSIHASGQEKKGAKSKAGSKKKSSAEQKGAARGERPGRSAKAKTATAEGAADRKEPVSGLSAKAGGPQGASSDNALEEPAEKNPEQEGQG
jgi:large subunit ribosomal protein L15